MKVLLVHNRYQQPGGEDTVFRLEQQLLKRFGHRIVTYTRTNQEVNRYASFRRPLLFKQMIWAEDARQDVSRILREERPDIVHVHNTFTQISPSIYAECREAGIPVVQTLHNFRLLCPAATFYRSGHVCEECITHSLQRGVIHGCYRNSRLATAAVTAMLVAHRSLHTWNSNINAYIALTEFARKKFICGGLSPEKIFVKPNFVAPDPGLSAQRGGYALFVGRLSAEKGLSTLLRAWTRFKKAIPLRIVGDGPLRTDLENYAASNSLSSVRFLGRLDHDKTWAAIKEASFLILPSECYENFPMTIVEAFASATPVICSGQGAMQEIVEDHGTGLHFEPNNSDDLADKVAWAWSRPARMRTMGMSARGEYELKYTAEKNYMLLMDIYQQATQTPASSDYDYKLQQEFAIIGQPW